jgi:plastocyanin
MPKRSLFLLAATTVLVASLIGTSTPAGAAPTRDDAPIGTVDVVIAAFTYLPDPVVERAGRRVTAINVDSTVVNAIPGHSITANNGAFDSGVFRGVRSFRAPRRPGLYPFHCIVHPFMRGLLVVTR